MYVYERCGGMTSVQLLSMRKKMVMLGLSGIKISTRIRITRIMTYKQDTGGVRGY